MARGQGIEADGGRARDGGTARQLATEADAAGTKQASNRRRERQKLGGSQKDERNHREVSRRPAQGRPTCGRELEAEAQPDKARKQENDLFAPGPTPPKASGMNASRPARRQYSVRSAAVSRRDRSGCPVDGRGDVCGMEAWLLMISENLHVGSCRRLFDIDRLTALRREARPSGSSAEDLWAGGCRWRPGAPRPGEVRSVGLRRRPRGFRCRAAGQPHGSAVVGSARWRG